MDPIDISVVRVKFSRLPFKKSWTELIWREAQNWPRHHISWRVFPDLDGSVLVPSHVASVPGDVRIGPASLAPLGFFVDGSYD